LATLEHKGDKNLTLMPSPARANEFPILKPKNNELPLGPSDVQRSLLSIQIDKAKATFKKNEQLQKRYKNLAENVQRKHKQYKKLKRRILKNSRDVIDEELDGSMDDIEDDEAYYKLLFDGADRMSSASLYATTPENMNEVKPDDTLAGEEAIFNAHSKFKTYNKIKQKQILAGEAPKYSLVEYLGATDSKKILPKTLGLVKRKPVDNPYPLENVRSIFIGKEYAEPFAEGIKMINKVKDLDLTSSDLHGDMVIPILKKVPISLESLNISYNYNLTSKVFKALSVLVDDKDRW
jgi:hypothetical protein